MYILKRDLAKCDDCKDCEALISEFTTKYKEGLMISDSNFLRTDCSYAIDNIIKICSNNAIYLDSNNQ